ncbi:capsid morphogenesis protein [Microbacterium phage Hyperion]|uniref:Capsid morphogenesis protein n=1 Tax=Microbacterium phage Hyperion TaxID=2182354 RepID=A0A2U8UIP8_9CAUD|nr:virion structural protein [Microbacterium phage Hyperion]AWN03539.1 capsid morphogenesis protein [Microbacterium phage Hyperion]
MEPQEFAAKRQERLLAADAELRDLVREALSAWNGEGEFDPTALQEAVEVIWLEHFSAEAPLADYERFLPRFRKILTESLAQTSAAAAGEPADYEVERITVFLGTLAVNDGTFRGIGARGGKFKRWTSMHDPSVRHAHSLVDGQVRSIGEPFTVEGVDLQYPGQPIGDPSVWINCRCVAQPAAAKGDANVSDTTMTLSDDFDSRSRSLTADAGTEEDTGVGVFLIPAEGDPIVAASSEDQAHMTTIWLGSKDDLPTPDYVESLQAEVAAYAATLDGPVVVPVAERGTLGDDDADVMFLEATESLVALRDGMLEGSPVTQAVYNSVEQYPDWTPHVTLGYPETPAAGEYDGDAVTFDRVGLWIGPDRYEYPMGDPVSKSLAAGGIIPAGSRPLVGGQEGSPDYVIPLSGNMNDQIVAMKAKLARLVAAGVIEPGERPVVGTEIPPSVDEDDEMPVDELEDGEEEVTEIPVHGVATLEGKATGDGRGFRADALSFGPMPQPLGYEYVSGHGADTSHVAIVGRIDRYERVPAPQHGDGVFEIRWWGVIMPGKEYGARAIESIVDGSYTGLSVIVDSVTVDVTDERERMLAQFKAERDADGGVIEADDGAPKEVRPRTDEELEALVDEWVGDGTQPTTWFSKAQIRRFDMVPTGAFEQGYTALGHEFEDELTEEQIITAAAALEDCGCRTRLVASAGLVDDIATWDVVDLSSLTPEEVTAYDLMDVEEQREFVRERGLVASAGFAPGTKDGPGWITHPVATSRIRRYWTTGKGAAKIGWGTPGDFNRCRAQLAKYVQNPDWLAGLCANMHKEVLGVWPGRKRGDKGHSLAASGTERTPVPLAVMASASGLDVSTVYPASAFEAPQEGRAFAMQIDKQARTIRGYAAQWGTCHIGIAGVCQEPPESATDYSYFRKGVVDTDQGEQRVALITYGIGHASEYASAAAATAHYDQTSAVRCYINIGEDAYGIWYSGVFVPWATEADMDAMRAIGRVSGDWRNWSGRANDYEMVGLVCVNTDGFQLAASAAIGIGALEKGQGEIAPVTFEAGAISLSRDDVAGIALAAAEQVFHLQSEQRAQQENAERLAAARAAATAYRLAGARAALNKILEG